MKLRWHDEKIICSLALYLRPISRERERERERENNPLVAPWKLGGPKNPSLGVNSARGFLPKRGIVRQQQTKEGRSVVFLKKKATREKREETKNKTSASKITCISFQPPTSPTPTPQRRKQQGGKRQRGGMLVFSLRVTGKRNADWMLHVFPNQLFSLCHEI